MECQVEKLEFFWHILLFEFNRGAKAAEAARNICVMYGDNAIGGSFWHSTFRKTFGVWWRSFKHINTQWSTSVNSRTRRCDVPWPFHHRATFAVNGQGSRCMGAACSKPKPQKSAGGHMCISAFLVIDWLVNNIDHSYPASLLVTRNGVYANRGKRNEWLSPSKKRICGKCSSFSTWHSIF